VSLLIAPVRASAPADTAELHWDIATFARVVQPMRHDTVGRLPLFLWNVPLPRDSTLVRTRQDGTLRRAIDQLAERGIVPTVQMGWEWTPDGALAMAQTLREAGRPVYLLIPDAELVERGSYSDTTVWVTGPDASLGGRERRWPCLPLADPWAGAARVRELVQPFKDAGIELSGVWFDDEALPHPWNGVYEAQKGSPDCVQYYPIGALADWSAFQRYVFGLRTDLQSSVMADPVHVLFPKARVGNYHEAASSADVPFVDEGGNSYPPRSLGRLDALMPSAYANTLHLARLARAEAPTQEAADRLYFFLLLRTVSTANANKAPGKVSVPFVSRFVRDDQSPAVRFGMSQQAYRELIRHVLLRGSDGLYLFNLGYPGSPVTPAESFESIEDARAVYDEMLAHRDFLDRGKPMTYAVPTPDGLTVIWSGLCLPDRCLVRTVTLGPETRQVMLEPFPGLRVTLDAPSTGASYVVRRDGRVVPATK
jgi:hypothetical protein